MKLINISTNVFLVFLGILTASTAVAKESRIIASSGAMHIEWSGDTGLLHEDAHSGKRARHFGLTYLRTDVGPKGHADYLLWLLARDNTSFKIIWGYMNNKGNSFWAWIYHYPENIATISEFKGKYTIDLNQKPHPESSDAPLQLRNPPDYTGHPFKFSNWTSDHGAISKLSILASDAPDKKPTTLKNLEISPLHEIDVPALNGWRTNSWQELHALGKDSTNSLYYLILYSNSTKGYIINLPGAWVSPVDFGEVVNFKKSNTPAPLTLPEAVPNQTQQVSKFSTFEAELKSSDGYKNPFTDQSMDVDLLSPEGKQISLMGFWAGNNTWKFRFAPMATGVWQWRTRSQDKLLDAHEGSFECIPQDEKSHGFLKYLSFNRGISHFTWSDNTPFLPTTIETASFLPRRNLDMLSELKELSDIGIDRITGVFLLDNSNTNLANSAITALVKSDLQQLSTEYFDFLDKFIQQACEKDIVIEIGLAKSRSQVLSRYKDTDLRRFWRYIIARYASYNIAWKVIGDTNPAISHTNSAKQDDFGAMLRLYDLHQHPVGGIPSEAIGEMDESAWLKIWDAVMRMRTPYLLIANPSILERKANNHNLMLVAHSINFLKRTKYWRLSLHPELIDKAAELQQTDINPAHPDSNKLLADPGWEYVLWLPVGGSVVLDLVEAAGHLKTVWYNPKTDQTLLPNPINGAGHIRISAPDSDPWVLHLSRR